MVSYLRLVSMLLDGHPHHYDNKYSGKITEGDVAFPASFPKDAMAIVEGFLQKKPTSRLGAMLGQVYNLTLSLEILTCGLDDWNLASGVHAPLFRRQAGLLQEGDPIVTLIAFSSISVQ